MKGRLGLNWEGQCQAKKRYTPEEIIEHLRTVELETGKGLAVLDACRKLWITEQPSRPDAEQTNALGNDAFPWAIKT